MPFKHLSIIGLGLLGGSLAAALKKLTAPPLVSACDSDPATLEAAEAAGCADLLSTSAAEAVAGADAVVICTPVVAFEQVLDEIAASLTPGCVVTDVGSTKRAIVATAERVLNAAKSAGCFVGSHPMAGSERSGLAAADADLFAGRTCIVTPTDSSPPRAVEAVSAFWRDSLAMEVASMAPEAHDAAMARLSHLPHLLAAMLMNMQRPGELPLAGKGLADTTRIAAGPAALWTGISLSNRDNLADELDTLSKCASTLADQLRSGDAGAMEAFLARASRLRSELDS